MTNDGTKSGITSPVQFYIAMGLLAAAGGVLATPLTAGPAVLLALIATFMLPIKGRRTLHQFGQSTLQARNVLLIAFGGWFFAELLSTAINNRLWTNLDYPFRFLLGIGVFWIIRYAAVRRTEFFFYGIAASALAAAVAGFYQYFMQDMGRALGWMNHPIYFGNLSVLLCVYAVTTLSTLRAELTARMRWLLAISIPLLMFAAFLSVSRSSWLGLTGLLVLIDWHRVNRTRLIGIGLAIATALILILVFVPELSSSLRITEAIQDARKLLDGDYRSSIGDRLQMWKAALLMFLSSPLVGVGSGIFQVEAAKLAASGAVDIVLVDGTTIFNQAHSEIMDILATKGLVGLLAYVILLALPFRILHPLAATENARSRAFALMGQATCIAFLMFGLTLATFKVQIYCAVFPVMIAMFTAMALNLADDGRTGEHAHGR